MLTIGLYNHKGGVGKTTLSVHCAFLALKEKKRCLLVDFDKQCSSLKWFSGYEWNSQEECWEEGDGIVRAVSGRNGYEVPKDTEFVIMDFPPNSDDEIKKATADVWLVPMDGRLSIEGAVDVAILKKKQNLIGVINKAPISDKAMIGQEELASAKLAGLTSLFDIRIPYGESIRRAEMLGKPVWDVSFAMRSKSGQNLAAFSSWVIKTKCHLAK